MRHAHIHPLPREPRVGDIVSFPFGSYTARGDVIEDRGHLGRDGERIIRVRVEVGNDLEPLLTEIPSRVATVVRSR
ncbi:MAG: hypothetical protein HS104_09145 [Polyangiaceae bacterium]|nr:hypothetical protein [Polyangiaceae bacterium]MCL4754129.1 hypothetical protein [Myxococcales bacterium]